MRSPLRLCHEYGDFTMGGLRRGVVHEVIEPFPSPALQRLAHSRHEVVERADIALRLYQRDQFLLIARLYADHEILA